ncbi:MAG: hypothetical protein RLZZ26_220 [Candidatus Parcubacteria bacterium]|jgi:methylenetetrahydrofolate dehydrogenase (NADP+)/methenyltetrahydrofolate cyclohydrolase
MSIDGRILAQEVLARAKARASLLARPPRVVAIVGSETPATLSYLRIKTARAADAGCVFEVRPFGASYTDADAVIIQLPLPPGVDQNAECDRVPVGQDADVLSRAARELFEKAGDAALLPPVVSAVQKILEFGRVAIAGKKAAVVGTGFLVGAPVATWLKQQGANVVVVTRDSGDLSASLCDADIIVSGTGSPHLIKPDMLKDGAVLIDAGTSESGGAIVGDADPACADKCALFTPVPGGVGPLAVACLFENAVTLTERTTKI